VREDRAYLLHAADAIVDYTQAVKGISEQTRSLDPAVPWRQIASMRDKLIHEYFGVDLTLVWDVVERDLPSLRPRIQALVDRVGQ
jgi:uncharacterized protein with HEPN domain